MKRGISNDHTSCDASPVVLLGLVPRQPMFPKYTGALDYRNAGMSTVTA